MKPAKNSVSGLSWTKTQVTSRHTWPETTPAGSNARSCRSRRSSQLAIVTTAIAAMSNPTAAGTRPPKVKTLPRSGGRRRAVDMGGQAFLRSR